MQDLLDFEFDHKYMMRGLIIDKKRGNVLKMDRHKYVKIAFHGFKKLSREERLATYALQRVSSVGKLLLQHSRIYMTWTASIEHTPACIAPTCA